MVVSVGKGILTSHDRVRHLQSRQGMRIRQLVGGDAQGAEVSRAADVDAADEAALLADLLEPVLQRDGGGRDDEVVADVEHGGAGVVESLAGAQDGGVDGGVDGDGLERLVSCRWL